MNIGYCRVSTTDQTLDLQKDELQKAGCEKFFEEVASGAKEDRQKLRECIDFARKGDVIVCWKLDRIGRSLKHLIEVINELKDRGVGFRCLTQNLDTTTPSGMLVFHVFGAMAEFERSLIQERTAAGLSAARSRGRLGGRPKVDNSQRIKIATSLYNDGKVPVSEICKSLKVSRATFYRDLKAKAASSSAP
jgi:hypothetical protein